MEQGVVSSSVGMAGAERWLAVGFVLLLSACGVSTKPKGSGPGPSGGAGATGTAGSVVTGASGAQGLGMAGETGAGGSNIAGPMAGVDAAAGSGAGAAQMQPEGGVDSPPLSGVTISIGGTMVPKEKVVVFLHIGHSNMAGRATGPATLHAFNYDTDPHLWAYAKGGVFRPAMEPLSPDGATLGKAGPGMSILHAALALAPDAFIVSIGHGESGDTGGYCRNFRKGGLFYNNVMAPAMELKGKVTFAGVWGMFGVAENVDIAHAGTFGTCLAGIISDMRTDLGEPNLPFLIGDWEPITTGQFPPTSPIGMMIIPQLHMVAASTPFAKLINTDGLGMEDDHHYNYSGHQVWAQRGIALIKQAGWTPWAAP